MSYFLRHFASISSKTLGFKPNLVFKFSLTFLHIYANIVVDYGDVITLHNYNLDNFIERQRNTNYF